MQPLTHLVTAALALAITCNAAAMPRIQDGLVTITVTATAGPAAAAPEPTPAPTTSLKCDEAYCEDGTSWCMYCKDLHALAMVPRKSSSADNT